MSPAGKQSKFNYLIKELIPHTLCTFNSPMSHLDRIWGMVKMCVCVCVKINNAKSSRVCGEKWCHQDLQGIHGRLISPQLLEELTPCLLSLLHFHPGVSSVPDIWAPDDGGMLNAKCPGVCFFSCVCLCRCELISWLKVLLMKPLRPTFPVQHGPHAYSYDGNQECSSGWRNKGKDVAGHLSV